MPSVHIKNHTYDFDLKSDLDLDAHDPKLLALLDAIWLLEATGVDSVALKKLGPLAPLYSLTIKLIDGRSAVYEFSSVLPVATAMYQLTIAGGYWLEAQTLLLIGIRQATLALHEAVGLDKYSWSRLP